MNEPLSDPPPWSHRTDQSDLAEHKAGHAARCVRATPIRPAPPFGRVAAHLRSSGSMRWRPTWILATAGIILGLATVASAAHLDLLPAWVTRMVKSGPSTPAHEGGRLPRVPAPPVAPARSAPVTAPSPSLDQPGSEPVSPASGTPGATAGQRSASARPSPAPAARVPSPARQVALVDREQRPSRTVAAQTITPALPSPSAPTPLLPNRAPAALPSGEAAVLATPLSPAPIPEASRARTPRISPPGANSSPSPALDHASPATASPQVQDTSATYLAHALHALRVDHAPAAALRLLDRHERELAKDGFAHEALLLRVEALLALGRRGELLRLLDRSSLIDVAASRALLLTRGELRAAAQRCAEGIGDFERALALSRQTDWQALVGRAQCRKRLGDMAGMRADVERLRTEFPHQPLPHELAPQ